MLKYLLPSLLFIVYSLSYAQPSYKADAYLDNLMDVTFRIDTAAFEPLTAFLDIDVEDDEWRHWKTLQNFSFGMDRGSLPMIADLEALHPYFRDKVLELIHACKKKGIDLAIVETFRTHAKQAEFFGMGKGYTRSAGGQSKHQYGFAVDVVPLRKGVPQWNDKVLWKKVGTIGESLGLRWGGRWRKPYDPAHFEWTGGLTSWHLSRGVMPPIAKPERYPCIEEDVSILRKYWEAWEAEQSVMSREVTPSVGTN